VKQLLIYDRPRELNRVAHRQLRLSPAPVGFAFARGVNSVPLVAAEFQRASLDYPIVFAGAPGAEQPAVLLGLAQGDNLFVGDDGSWALDAYVPAFIRRYPFVLAEKDGGEDFTVCIDEAFAGLGTEEGAHLFNADGSESSVLTHAVKFLTDFQVSLKQTRGLTTRLRDLGLLQSRTLQVQTATGITSTLDGFQVVDATLLAAIKGKPLQALHASGDLAVIHAHLSSLQNVQRLSARMDRRQPSSNTIN
jgi:hypothetical protein